MTVFRAAGDVVAPTDDMYDPTSGRVIPTGPPPGFNPGDLTAHTAIQTFIIRHATTCRISHCFWSACVMCVLFARDTHRPEEYIKCNVAGLNQINKHIHSPWTVGKRREVTRSSSL